MVKSTPQQVSKIDQSDIIRYARMTQPLVRSGVVP